MKQIALGITTGLAISVFGLGAASGAAPYDGTDDGAPADILALRNVNQDRNQFSSLVQLERPLFGIKLCDGAGFNTERTGHVTVTNGSAKPQPRNLAAIILLRGSS